MTDERQETGEASWVTAVNGASRRGEQILRKAETGLRLAGVPLRQQHLQAPSDIGGSGGVPRWATAWETEARSVPAFVARIVNTEGPGP